MAERSLNVILPAEKKDAKIIAEKKSKLDEIRDTILEARKTGFSNYINTLKPLDILLYSIIIQIGVLIGGQLNFTLGGVVGLVGGMVIVFYLAEQHRSKHIGMMKEIDIKLYQISDPEPKYFYIDANIIDLFYELIVYRKEGDKTYQEAVKAANNFLKVRYFIENNAETCEEYIDIARDLRDQVLNALQSLTFVSPPVEIMDNRLKEIINLMKLYLQRHLDFMVNKCNGRFKKLGYMVHSHPVTRQEIKGFDLMESSMYNLY